MAGNTPYSPWRICDFLPRHPGDNRAPPITGPHPNPGRVRSLAQLVPIRPAQRSRIPTSGSISGGPSRAMLCSRWQQHLRIASTGCLFAPVPRQTRFCQPSAYSAYPPGAGCPRARSDRVAEPADRLPAGRRTGVVELFPSRERIGVGGINDSQDQAGATLP